MAKYLCEQMTFEKGVALDWNSNIDSNGHFMFRSMTESRKRSRDDDTCEFMPLSKRINNLNLNNNLMSPPSLSQSSDSNQSNGIITDNGISSSSSSETECRPSYDPGITSSDSRYYYDNKLLFELHLERIQRSGQQFPF